MFEPHNRKGMLCRSAGATKNLRSFVKQMSRISPIGCVLRNAGYPFLLCNTVANFPADCLRFEDNLREGGVAVMRDGEGDVFHAEAIGDRARRA